MKTTKYIYNDTEVFVHSFDDNSVTDVLKPAVYQLKFDKFVGFFLTTVSDHFETPEVIYGSTDRRVERVLTTYEQRPDSTGVLLSGQKGSGKTMTASIICNKLIEKGIPVILINEPHSGSGFIEFLGNIGEAVLFFDEFGKTYNEKKNNDECVSQEELLTLFDGTHSCKRLVLLTENETRDINSFMLNRPGRIYYHFKHDKLDEDMIVEYCERQGVPIDVIKQIKSVRNKTTTFSFDILVAIVTEWKRFGDSGESIEQLIVDLNVPQDGEGMTSMRIEEAYDVNTKQKLFISENCGNCTYIVPETNERAGCIDYFTNEELSKDSNGDYNYNLEQSYHIDISDIVEKTLDSVTFFDKNTGHAFKFKIIPPSYRKYGSAF